MSADHGDKFYARERAETRAESERYRLNAYFPGSREKRTEQMYATPQQSELINHDAIVYALLGLSCVSIHVLAGKYYNSRNFSDGGELFNTFIELPRETACLFLAKEVSRDLTFWDLAVRDAITSSTLTETVQELSDMRRQQVEDEKTLARTARGDRVCNKETLPHSLNCPRGYALGNDDAVTTRAGVARAWCCVTDPDAKHVTPLVWNEKIETTVLHSIRDALLETIKLHLSRRVFESSRREFVRKSCDDKDIVQPKAAIKVAAEKVSGAGRAVTRALKRTFERPVADLRQYALNFKGFLLSFPDVNRSFQWASNIVGVAKDFLKQFYVQFVGSKYEAVLLRNVKKRRVETACEYIIKENLLDSFTPLHPITEDSNHRKTFATRLKGAYRHVVRRQQGAKQDIRKELWDIFSSKFQADEKMYNEVFSDTLGNMLGLLSEASLGISDIFLNAAERVTNEIIFSAFEKVFVAFFYMDLSNMDIFEYIVTVLDVSRDLAEHPLTARRYAFLLDWRSRINSQIFGADVLNESIWEAEASDVMDRLWKINFSIAEIEAAVNGGGTTFFAELPNTFDDFERMIKTSQLATEPRLPAREKQLLLTDETYTEAPVEPARSGGSETEEALTSASPAVARASRPSRLGKPSRVSKEVPSNPLSKVIGAFRRRNKH